MTRSFQAAAAALILLTAPAFAQAADLKVAYSPADLASSAGRPDLRDQVAAAADAFCRANPVGHTITECRRDITAQLSRQLEVRVQRYAQAHSNLVLAQH